MGAGIAKVIRERFPAAYVADCATQRGDRKKLGTFSYAVVSAPQNPRLKYIINLYGQYGYGHGKCFTDYEAVQSGLELLKYKATTGLIPNIKSIALPYLMGCGHGGGDWDKIMDIVAKVFANSGVDVFICQLPGSSR